MKQLVALLWARSYATRATSDRIRRETAAARGPGIKASPQLRAAFKADYGRDPEPSEIDAHVEARLRDFVASANEIYVKAVVDNYNRAVEHFRTFTVSLYSADKLPYGLITSDIPVVLARDNQLRDVGGNPVVGLLEARIIYTPLHRRMGACLMTTNESARLASVDVVRLNNAVWRNARTHVVAHPDEDWRTASGLPDPRT